MSNGPNDYKSADVSFEEIEDEELAEHLVETFVTDGVSVWDVSHFRIMPNNSVYSAINMQSRLLLVETKEGQSNVLKDLHEDWFVSEIVPVHIEINGRPVLLLTMGINETDMMWTSLAVYDGKEYVFPANNRMKGF